MTEQISSLLSTYLSNARNNLSSSFSALTIQNYIRLIVIVGAYALLRPYLIKLGGKFQEKDHAREITAEELAGFREGDNDDDDEEEEADESTGAWGTTARKRQKRVVKQLLEAEERRREEEAAGEEDLKDIQEFLVD